MFPPVTGGKNNNKYNNQQGGQQQNDDQRGVFPEKNHLGPAIPAGKQVGKNSHYQHHGQGQAGVDLPEHFFFGSPVLLPIDYKILFFGGQHNSCKNNPSRPGNLSRSYKIYILYALKAKTLKLALILAQYLYINKRLDLPGIGSFYLDPAFVIDPELDKNTKKEPTDSIRFEYNAALKENTEVINYIASKTGKIKALAAADLDSHLWLGQQFLNIGKPFVLDGIGQLLKTQAGQLTFTSGVILPEVLKEQPGRQPVPDHSSQEREHDYSDLLHPRKEKMQWKKPAAVILVLAGIVVAIWGGYIIYKRNSAETEETKTTALEKEKTALPAPVPGPASTDTGLTIAAAKPVLPAGNYKFVVETAGKQRALARYQKLKNLPTDVRMETADSVTFKLYFLLPATPADTAKIRDSLRLYYTPKWSMAFVEQ